MDHDVKGYAEIYNLLPIELQNKVKYLVLEHPVAKIIKDEIRRLRCDEYHTFRDEQGRVFCKIDGKLFFANQYFYTFDKRKDKNRAVMNSEDDSSATSDEYMNDVFDRLFFVSSTSSSSDED
jgi:hypothetical protein